MEMRPTIILPGFDRDFLISWLKLAICQVNGPLSYIFHMFNEDCFISCE